MFGNQAGHMRLGGGRTFVQSAPSSDRLARNLINAGIQRPLSSEAHHIVAGTSRKADEAWAVLERFEIDINSADNGVFLPGNLSTPTADGLAVHRAVHRDAYFREVNALLGRATTRGEVLEALEYVRQRLLGGGFP